MTDRPILFSAPMVRAILAGTKTQTRRVITKFPWKFDGDNFMREFAHHDCPMGHPGDRLWVRETWAETINVNDMSPWPDRPHRFFEESGSAVIYRADGEWEWLDDDGSIDEGHSSWKPSIFMPRWASRITLEITKVRVQRLQEISEEDAKAEGCSHVESFSNLWDSLNAKRGHSWESNPWVWVIEFRIITVAKEF